MGRDDEAQGALVRQMQQLLLRVDQRGEHRELLLLEGAEIGVFRDPPPLAQPLQHLAEVGLGRKPVLFEPPQRAEGGVEEFEPRVGPVDRDRRRDVLEHVGMGRDVPGELGLDVLEIGEVAGVADDLVGVGAERRLGELHQPARAVDDDVVALRLGDRGGMGALGEGAAAAGDDAGGDLAPFGDGDLLGRVDGGGEGAVAVGERQVAGAPPDRQRQGIERGAQMIAVALQRRRLGDHRLAPPRIAEPDDVGEPVALGREGAAAGDVEQAARGKRGGEGEARAVALQTVDGAAERGGVLRREAGEHVLEARRRREVEAFDERARRPFPDAARGTPDEAGGGPGRQDRHRFGEGRLVAVAGRLARREPAARREGDRNRAGDRDDEDRESDEGKRWDGDHNRTPTRSGRPRRNAIAATLPERAVILSARRGRGPVSAGRR